MVIHSNENPFKCQSCSASFGLKNNLERHIRMTHDETFQPFICSQCPKNLTTKRTLEKHEQRHIRDGIKLEEPGEKTKSKKKYIRKQHWVPSETQVCSQCGKSYTVKQHLDIHIKVIHLKQKEFSCGKCDKKFGRRSSLSSHLKTKHVDARRFVCEFCPKSYKEKRNLQNHVDRGHLTQIV